MALLNSAMAKLQNIFAEYEDAINCDIYIICNCRIRPPEIPAGIPYIALDMPEGMCLALSTRAGVDDHGLRCLQNLNQESIRLNQIFNRNYTPQIYYACPFYHGIKRNAAGAAVAPPNETPALE